MPLSDPLLVRVPYCVQLYKTSITSALHQMTGKQGKQGFHYDKVEKGVL